MLDYNEANDLNSLANETIRVFNRKRDVPQGVVLGLFMTLDFSRELSGKIKFCGFFEKMFRIYLQKMITAHIPEFCILKKD